MESIGIPLVYCKCNNYNYNNNNRIIHQHKTVLQTKNKQINKIEDIKQPSNNDFLFTMMILMLYLLHVDVTVVVNQWLWEKKQSFNKEKGMCIAMIV
jgi:ABC-type uncharacterized transport system fused permease/ATPase subunit